VSSALRYEIGPIRPPNEAYSLLVRFTRNCPWNRCEFCHVYKGKRFERRAVADIKKDIDTIRKIRDVIVDLSSKKGHGGAVTESLLEEIYSDPGHSEYVKSVAVWLYFGGRNVFLQDANSLVMKVDDLVESLTCLKETFPSIERITSYARSQTIAQLWPVDNLKRLKEAGLTRLHLGLESGLDDLLRLIRKGVTKGQQIEAGARVKEAGVELSEYVVPGLGGRKWWRHHALETADTLNRINPDFIRLRTLKVTRDMPLYGKIESGELELQTDEEILEEIRLFVETLDVTSTIKSDHILNLLEEIDGKLPEDKGKILSVIDRYHALNDEQKVAYRFGRRAGMYRGLDDLDDQVTYFRIKKTMHQMEEQEPGSVERQLSRLLDTYI
jgi:radical SAM superfamily enzyme YgiQ (UPF0313 family)